MSWKPVRKAVFPVAGLGTRLLPATKAMPKEMLTVVDRPLIQYAVDEAREAGIEQMIFVTGRGKGALDDHFDVAYELEATMKGRGKSLEPLEITRMPAGSVVSVRQQEPLGLGHAVWCARDIVGDEPFAVLLPDMVSFGDRGCLAGAVELYDQTGGNVIAVEQCDPLETARYGIVGRGNAAGHGFAITGMVEKPNPAAAPSNYYINGRYVLQPEIFGILGRQERGAGDEIQLTDAMQQLLED